MELVDFLRARLDEDAELARAATQGDWVWSREFVTPPGYHHRTIGPLEPGDAVHISRHNPARVLADVETKRRIVENLAAVQLEQTTLRELRAPLAEVTLRMLARAYRDHPDFDPAWLED